MGALAIAETMTSRIIYSHNAELRRLRALCGGTLTDRQLDIAFECFGIIYNQNRVKDYTKYCLDKFKGNEEHFKAFYFEMLKLKEYRIEQKKKITEQNRMGNK